MTRLAILGSGETTPTMVSLHQRLIRGADDPVVLSTPYGFQMNAADITARTCTYFEHHVGVEVRALPADVTAGIGALDLATLVDDVRRADWVFAGPGSPSYLLRQWRATPLPDLLREKLTTARDDVLVFASAAACTLGSHAVPVYEIYKAGEPPHWLEGLDLLAAVGLDAVVIPHFDNAEGGTHDTRFCYLGEDRLARMETELPEDTWVLGVDEHTAAVLDVVDRSMQVSGRGAVTVRSRGRRTRFPAGAIVGFEALRAAAHGAATTVEPAAEAESSIVVDGAAIGSGQRDQDAPAGSGQRDQDATAASLSERVTTANRAFDRALDRGDALAATEQVLLVEAAIEEWSSDTLQSEDHDRARQTLRQMIMRLGRVADAGLHDHRDLVAPHVETLLDLRTRARTGGDYDTADEIREALTDVGVDVRDRPDGTEWDWEDPLRPE